jgi:tetraacyldisaccharide 4'-kinase
MHRDAVSRLLWPASVAFGAAARLRRLAYKLGLARSHRAGLPVIVVGNLIAGGSGKTPLALWITERLRERGFSPAIVSRGYASAVEAPREATIASDPAEVGDEPMVLARRSGCPVWVGPDRVAVIGALRAQHPDCNALVLDDGLQHYALARDIEIAIVDSRAFGNGWLLPAGPLREPPRRLRSVGAVIAHDLDKDVVRRHAGNRPIFSMTLRGSEAHRAVNALDRRMLAQFAGQPVHAVAGIGNPERFFRHLQAAGVHAVEHPFPDHHPFVPADLEFGDEAPVLMTEKDAVKCKRFAKPHHWVLPVSAQLEPAFAEWLIHAMKSRA